MVAPPPWPWTDIASTGAGFIDGYALVEGYGRWAFAVG